MALTATVPLAVMVLVVNPLGANKPLTLAFIQWGKAGALFAVCTVTSPLTVKPVGSNDSKPTPAPVLRTSLVPLAAKYMLCINDTEFVVAAFPDAIAALPPMNTCVILDCNEYVLTLFVLPINTVVLAANIATTLAFEYVLPPPVIPSKILVPLLNW